MSYNKDYRNIIGQYDGSTISEQTGLQIGQGLGKGTINLTNGSSTGTVNDVTITNTAGTSIGYNTNKFNLNGAYSSGRGYISVVDSLTGDIYNMSIQYLSSTSFTITGCSKLSYSAETDSSSGTFSGSTGTYEYFIGHKTLVKNNSITICSNRDSVTNVMPIITGNSSIIITNGFFATSSIISGNNALMFGSGVISGDRSVVLGYGLAYGLFSLAIGTYFNYGEASGVESIAIAGVASGNGSVAIGGNASGVGSISIGRGTASGLCSCVLGGDSNSTSSDYSVIIGGDKNSITAGNRSVILGSMANVARGSMNIIAGGYKISSGFFTYASGLGSIVLGLSYNGATTLGIFSTADKYSSILGGNDNYIGVNGNTTNNSTYNTTIIGSQACAIYQSSTTDTSLMIYNGIYSSNNSYIRSLATASNLRTCNIIGAENSNITNNTGAQVLNNCLLNTNNVTLQNTNNTTVIGQTSTVTITESDIVYVGKEIVGGKVATTVLSSALSNTTSTIYNNIISFNAKAGAVYRLRLIGTYQTAATTTGIKVRMSGTAVANVTGYITGAITAATGATSLRATIASMTAELITTGVSAINTPHAIDGDIIVRCTTAGTVILQMASEVNGSAAQLNIGTAVIVERVI